MKWLLTLSFTVATLASLCQSFPSNPTQGNPSTKNVVLGAWEARKGMVVGVYSDTSSANSDTYTKGVPYITITTTSGGNVLWQRNSTATQWVQMSGGGGGGYDYSGKLDSVRRLLDLTVVEYSGSPSAVIANPIYKDSVGVTALFRSVGTDSVYAVINGLPVYQYTDSSGSSGSAADLQSVTDLGNTTSNSIVIGPSMLKLNPDGRVGSNQLDVYSGPDYSAPTGINSIVSSATGFWTNNLPNADGILAVAVNGNFAGTDGNIVVPVGGTTIDETIVATGGQTAFTFTSVPADYANYLIFINGAEIENTTYFTTSGNIVTFTSGLVAGDRVRYRRIK